MIENLGVSGSLSDSDVSDTSENLYLPLPPPSSASPPFILQAIRRLRKHPNVIQLAEIIYDKGSRTLYLVCELMDMNIYELIKDRTHYLNDHKVKHYMYQLLQVN